MKRRSPGSHGVAFLTLLLLAPPGLEAQPPGGEEAELLEMSLQELLALPVEAATRTRVPYIEVPQAVSVLTRAEIERLPALTLPDLLRFLPGANAVRLQSSQQVFGARGSNAFTPSKVLMLVDGQPIDPTLFSTTWWELVPISLGDIERVELVRSPGTIYGANAQNGVINIVTRRLEPGSEQPYHVETSVRVGEQRLRQTFVHLLGRAPSVDYRFSLEATQFEAFDNPERLEIVPGKPSSEGEQTFAGGREQLDVRNFSASARSRAAGHPLEANVGVKDIRNAQGRVPDRLCFVGVDGSVGYANLKYSFAPGPTRHEVILSADRINFTFLRNHDTQVLAPAEMTLTRTTLGYEAQRRAGSHNLLVGASVSLRDAQNESGTPFFVQEEVDDETVVGLRFQDEWRLGDRDLLYLGGLVSDHYVSGTTVSPLLAWVHTFGARHSLRVATFTSHRDPSVFEHAMDYDQTTGDPGKSTRLVSNPGLDAERTTSYEVGVRSQVRADLFLYADLYYNQVDDSIEWRLDGTEAEPVARPRYRSVNTLEQEILGIEAGFRASLGRHVSLEANATLTDVENHSETGDEQPSRYGDAYVPPYIANLQVGFTWPRLNGALHYQHVGSHTWLWPSWSAATGADRLSEKPVPSYGLLSASFAVPVTEWLSLELAGHNLLNDLHTEWRGDSSYFGRQVWAGVGFDF